MPRQARVKSETGIYHVMLKGIDNRDIFLDEFDRSKFIEQIIRAKEKGLFALLAYCLMDNHVHLLIKENEEIGKSIKRITVGYVIWQYLAAYNHNPCHIDSKQIEGYFNTQNEFEEFMGVLSDDKCLGCIPIKKHSDEALRKIILKEFHIESLEAMSIKERNQIIKKIYQTTGASVRQLGRVLGLANGIVQRGIR